MRQPERRPCKRRRQRNESAFRRLGRAPARLREKDEDKSMPYELKDSLYVDIPVPADSAGVPIPKRHASFFFTGDGKYVVRLTDCEARPNLYKSGFLIRVEMEIVESSNPDHPVGAKRVHVLRMRDDGSPFPVSAHGCAVLAQKIVHSVFSLHVPGNIKSMNVSVGFAKPSTPADEGATCKRCKSYNPYAEPSTAYVCFECR